MGVLQNSYVYFAAAPFISEKGFYLYKGVG